MSAIEESVGAGDDGFDTDGGFAAGTLDGDPIAGAAPMDGTPYYERGARAEKEKEEEKEKSEVGESVGEREPNRPPPAAGVREVGSESRLDDVRGVLDDKCLTLLCPFLGMCDFWCCAACVLVDVLFSLSLSRLVECVNESQP